MGVSDLEVTFRQRRRRSRALDGISLEWKRGEVLGVVGESGCGKSTLARAMLGLQETSGGEALPDWDGDGSWDVVDVDDDDAQDRFTRIVPVAHLDPAEVADADRTLRPP